MFEVFSIEAADARLRVKRAEISLRRANELLANEYGVALNLALCGRVRAEKRRVVEARQRLAKIDPVRRN